MSHDLPIDPESPTEKRIDEIGRTIFERAVLAASEIATQHVAQIHRRRLVTQSFLAALVISAGMGIVLAVAFKIQVDDANSHNAIVVCKIVQSIELPLSDFVTTDATLRRLQSKLSPEPASAQAVADATDYWTTSVVPRLNQIAGANCTRLLH